MNLNHNNLCTSDVTTLTDIFARHFDFEIVQAGKDFAGADFAVLRGADGFSLVLTTIGPDSPQAYPTNFHVGFTVDTPGEVHAKHQELSEAGRGPGPIKSFDALGAHWTAFYCPAGDGMAIEVNAHT